MTMNYELIYKCRKAGHKTDSLSNLEVSHINKARAEANNEHQKYRDFLKKELGHENFEVTNTSCMADGIIGHVYVGTATNGHGKRVCAFCGIDDFDY